MSCIGIIVSVIFDEIFLLMIILLLKFSLQMWV